MQVVHAGRAASNGLLAALLAQQGFDSSEEIVEGKRGFARIYSDVAKPESRARPTRRHWEIARNGYKPYACGVVLHPMIDAVVALGERRGIAPTPSRRIEARVHPIAVRITGRRGSQERLMSKFSIYHRRPSAYLDRAPALRGRRPARRVAGRGRRCVSEIASSTDEGFRKDQAQASVGEGAGERHRDARAHASGTAANPMSDQALEVSNFSPNAAPAVGDARARQIAATAWRLASLTDVREFIGLCA